MNDRELYETAERNREMYRQQRLRKEEFERKSKSGSNGKRTGKKKKITMNDFKHKVKNVTIGLLLVTTISQAAIVSDQFENITEDYKERLSVGNVGNEIHETYIADNTYRVNNNEDFAYDWDGIKNDQSDILEKYPAEVVYATDKQAKYTDIDQVTQHLTEYDSYDELMKAEGHKDFEDVQESIHDNKEEILKMIEEDKQETNTSESGLFR